MALTYLGDIKEALDDFKLTKHLMKGKDETGVSKMILQHLIKAGLKVTKEKQVGFLKFLVDIDYNNGRACIEVKLAKKLIADTGATGEMQRLFGQTSYFVKHYGYLIPVVMVLIVGEESLKKDPRTKEVKKHVEKLGAEFVYMVVK